MKSALGMSSDEMSQVYNVPLCTLFYVLEDFDMSILCHPGSKPVKKLDEPNQRKIKNIDHDDSVINLFFFLEGACRMEQGRA